MKMNTPEEKQLLKQFEIVNGCTSDMFDDKDWIKFERFCERQYKEKKNFYCGDEVDHGEKCEFQCEGCNDATGVDYGFLPQEKELYCRNGLCDGKGECDYNGCQCQGERLKIQQEKTLDNIISEKMLEKADVTVTLHKGTVLTTEEVMKERSSVYEFIDFEETLEQAAEKEYTTIHEQYQYDAFIKGAEWKKERSYTEKDIREAIDYGANLGLADDIGNSFQWRFKQDEFILRKKETKTEKK